MEVKDPGRASQLARAEAGCGLPHRLPQELRRTARREVADVVNERGPQHTHGGVAAPGACCFSVFFGQKTRCWPPKSVCVCVVCCVVLCCVVLCFVVLCWVFVCVGLWDCLWLIA